MAADDKITQIPEREELVPIVTRIAVCYVCIMIAGYFIGNFIYQIP